jgi:predicted acylesterase/phospholipase RssA
MSRSQRVWWNVSSSLMTLHLRRRSTSREQTYVAWQIENRHTLLDNEEWACVIRQKWDLTIRKNWRWDDQAWSREWIISNNFCKEQIWIAFFRSHLTFRDKTQNTLSAYFRKQFVLAFIATVNLRWNLIKSCKKRRLLRAKKLIIVMFSKKTIHKQNVHFHSLWLAFSEVRARYNLFVKSNV